MVPSAKPGRRVVRHAAAFAVCATLLPHGALAQDTASTAKPATSRAHKRAQPVVAGTGEEITVTARRRSEPLEKVPVAVSVVSAADAARSNLNGLEGITQLVPEANFRANSSNKDRTIFIRGIGTISTSPGVEPSVSTVVDGVVLARSGQATADLVDLDHVEVLRGPQGTLFGKNASAGAVNIVTKEPTASTQRWLDGGYFTGGNEWRVGGGLAGTLVKDRLTGILGFVTSGYDGNVTNAYTGKKINGYSHDGFRGKLRYTPDDTTRITLGMDYMGSQDSVPNGVFVSSSQRSYPTGSVTRNAALASALSAAGVNPGGDNTTVSNNVKSRTRDDNGGFALTVDKKLGAYALTSITAYRRWHNTQFQDYDQQSQVTSSFPQLADKGDLDFSQFSQEARIASPKGHLIDYVAGLYYMHADDDETYGRNITQLTAGQLLSNGGLATFGTTGNNYAIFGEGNINLTKSLRLIAGGRLIRDTLDYSFNRATSASGAYTGIRKPFASTGETSANGYVDRFGIQYDVTSRIMTYATYSRGYKGPAYNVFFNMQATDTGALKPETSNSYEIGAKSRFFHDRLTVNLAAYTSDFYNYQANFLDSANGALVTRLINAGTVSSRGIEADITARPIRNLTLNAALSRLDAHIVDFNCPPTAATSCNVNGEKLPFAPDWKLDVSSTYVVALNDALDVSLQSTYDWQSATQYSLSETPDTVQSAYGLWGASIALIDNDQGWRVTGLVRNILNKHYSSYLADGNLGGLVRWVPRDNNRYFGVMVHKDF